MSFNIQCPHCGTPLEVEDEWAGMECECPQCRQKMMIPKPAAEPPRATPQIQPPPYPRSTPPPYPRSTPPVNPPPRQPGYWQNTQSGNPPPPPQSNYSISYDSEESSGSDWSFGGKILKYIIVAALALGWFFLQDKLGCSESTESSARSVVTKILAENDDIPAELRHVKCKEVKLGGEISRQEFPELGVHVLGGTCYRGVATLDNGEKLKILIAKSSKEIYVQLDRETQARFIVTQILAENENVPFGLRHAKCREVRITGNCSASDLHGQFAVPGYNTKYFRGVATLDNGRTLNILIEVSSSRIEVKVVFD